MVTNIIDINPTKLVNTVNVHNLNAPSSETVREEKRKKTQLHVVFKKLTLNTNTSKLKVNAWKKK